MPAEKPAAQVKPKTEKPQPQKQERKQLHFKKKQG
jgi:hypothetical protein